MNTYNLEKKRIDDVLIENIGLGKNLSYKTKDFNCGEIQNSTKNVYFANSFVAFGGAFFFLLLAIFTVNNKYINIIVILGIITSFILSYLGMKLFNDIKTVSIDIVEEKLSLFLKKCKNHKIDKQVVQYILSQNMHLDKIDDLMDSLYYYDKYTSEIKA